MTRPRTSAREAVAAALYTRLTGCSWADLEPAARETWGSLADVAISALRRAETP